MQRRLLTVILFVALAVGGALLLLGGDERLDSRNVVRPAIEPVLDGKDLAPSTKSDDRSAESAAEARRALDAARAEPALEAAASVATDASAATVFGRIVDERGEPVSGAALRSANSATTFGLHAPTGYEIHDAKIGVASTDSSGEFGIACQPGSVRLSIRAAGFAPRTVERLMVPAGGETTLDDDIVLERSASVTGVVLDSTGVPLEGARVVVRDVEGEVIRTAARREVRTLADGAFRFDELERAPLTLFVTDAVHAPHTAAIDARQPGPLPHLAIRMQQGDVIEGRVQGFPPDFPDAIAVVAIPHSVRSVARLENRLTEVDEQGFFRLRGLTADTQWKVFALPASKVDASKPTHVDARERISEAPIVDSGERHLVLEWEATCTVRVRVVDANTDEPIESLAVAWGKFLLPELSAGPDNVKEYEDGLVRLEGLRSDDGQLLAIQIDAVNYATWTKHGLAPEPGEEIDLGTIGLVPAPRMCITVVDDATGEPVAGAEVGWTEQDMTIAGEFAKALAASEGAAHAPWRRRSRGYGWHRTKLTDEHGFVRFDGRPGFIMELTVTAPGFASAHVTDWQLPRAGDAERVVRLGQGGAVDVLALDSAGQPLVGRTVEHRLFGLAWSRGGGFNAPFRGKPERSEEVTDSEGRARFRDLLPGGHEFRIAEPDDSGALTRVSPHQQALQEDAGWTAVGVTVGAVSELELTEAPRGVLLGRITDHGRPVARARVGLVSNSSSVTPDRMVFAFEHNSKTMRTDAGGRYRIDNVEPGPYMLFIQHPDYHSTFDEEVTLPAAQVQRDVELGTAVLAGRVVDENGRGVPDAVVVVGASDDGQACSYHRGSRMSAFRLRYNIDLLGSGEVRTDHDGAWEVRGLAPGVALVALTGGGLSEGQPACSEELTLSPGQRLEDVVLVVRRGGSLVVRFPAESGARSDLSGSLSLMRTVDSQREGLTTSFDGNTGRVDGVAPGTWTLRVQVQPPRHGIQQREIEIVAGETTYLDLALPD